MGRFFTRERFGRPQWLAGLLLLAFLAQCGLLVSRGRNLNLGGDEEFRLLEGLRQLQGKGIAGTPSTGHSGVPPAGSQNEGFDGDHSPLWYLVASAPLLAMHRSLYLQPWTAWGWVTRVPYLLLGVLLGASLWYVARRLYGNAGGFIALALYCFSPAIIRASSLWFAEPEIGAAWGAFGAIFTAIAVAHTLYAPREVVWWNWRRILLLGVSLALAVGSQFSLVVVVPVALGFMLYVAPTRRAAGLAIWIAGCAIGLLLLYSSYSFHARDFWQGMRHASWLPVTWQAFAMAGAYQRVLSQLAQSGPALVIALPAALLTYAVWGRTRYFGNTAPLLVAVLFLLLGLATPHYPGLGFELVAVPFLFVFVAGVAADLLEIRHRPLVLAGICGLLLANALWNVGQVIWLHQG